MSDKEREYVWDHSPYKGTLKLIHLKMADWANDGHDWLLWCGDSVLAVKAGCDRRTVVRTKAKMVEDGYLLDIHERHKNGNRLYRFQMPGTDQCDISSTSYGQTNATFHPPNATFRPDQCDISSTAPIINQSEPEVTTIVSNQMSFTDFWNCYPRRNGKRLNKPQALSYWKKIKSTELEKVMTGTRFYAESVENGSTLSAKDPDRWLRDRKWEDWQEPAIPDVALRSSGKHSAADNLADSLFGGMN